ncbi:hypothetical protein MNBD_GAMMA09-826 [hydrothermal vent metagenome]|uniref:HAMP domain-containing protein n=1 Tax=hydrothermal vent metagenome TaxID=652676 RepID=A0A3B0XNI2_9ZZZZ
MIMLSGIVAKVSFSICVVTFSVLMVAVSTVLVDHSGSYGDFIQSQVISRNNLFYVMVISGLFLIFVGAFISWLVSLYGSFRIVGPLYRFESNITQCIESGSMLMLRSDDDLQVLSEKIINSARQLENHKHEMLQKIDEFQQIAKLPDEVENREKLTEILKKLRQIESRALINE